MDEVIPEFKTLKKEKEEVPLSVLISIIHRSHSTYISKHIKEDNINQGQAPFLIYLNDKENISQNELAENFKMTDGVVTRALQKLEKNKYITRTIDSTNQRRKIIKITPEGQKLAEKLREIENNWEKEIEEIFNEEDLNKFRESLQKLSILSLDKK